METIDHKAYPVRLRSLSDAALDFIITDASAAIRANPQSSKAISGYYADEINYAGMEKYRRKNMKKSRRAT